ncbi:hypothetical protein PA27867_1224 [Cryobacterium arcticum]|uniref:Uncharacterized protein n=1 Tax=Cryobacterium arcticum TaxID=670052 RepID=A0A1B1BI03_9MICO|nr:hypothetical protein PA27867_1224 [Cryobacterium arcticum]
MARAACRGTVTKSRRPQPIVTRPGTVPAGAPCCLGPLVRAFNAAPVAGESASPRTSGSTVCCESAQGRADSCASSRVLPTELPSRAGRLPRSARTRAIEGRSVAPKTTSSRRFQNPPGSNATVSPPTPRRASSSTIRPPIDWPTVETPSSPCSRINSATESVSVAIETSPVNGAVSPNPGRSTAMTSRCSASSSRIGAQDRHPAPRPCTSSSGLPLPRRI